MTRRKFIPFALSLFLFRLHFKAKTEKVSRFVFSCDKHKGKYAPHARISLCSLRSASIQSAAKKILWKGSDVKLRSSSCTFMWNISSLLILTTSQTSREINSNENYKSNNHLLIHLWTAIKIRFAPNFIVVVLDFHSPANVAPRAHKKNLVHNNPLKSHKLSNSMKFKRKRGKIPPNRKNPFDQFQERKSSRCRIKYSFYDFLITWKLKTNHPWLPTISIISSQWEKFHWNYANQARKKTSQFINLLRCLTLCSLWNSLICIAKKSLESERDSIIEICKNRR